MLKDWLTGQRVERTWVPLSQMPDALVAAVLASEDSAFCDHFGVDVEQTQKSVKRAFKRDKPVKATSTITQQTAKNLYLWHGRSWLRKGLELPLSLWLELLWSKERILEVYLNIVELGDGIYGVDAAARHYFGVPTRGLSSWQSALIATALPDPIHRNASRPSGYHAQLAGNIASRLQNNGPDTSCLR